MINSHHRRFERQSFECKLRVYWQEADGREVYTIANSADLSESGMCILIPHRIEPRTYVQVKVDGHTELSGTACVRFCERRGLNYTVGLEFSGGTRHMAKAACD